MNTSSGRMELMFQRPYYLSKLIEFKDTDFIKIITGVRRSGKSVLLMLYKEYLIKNGIDKDHIIYINFESFNYQTINNENMLREALAELIPHDDNKIYFLFDEIQLVEGWQRVINGLRVSFNSDLVVTGSNANMLSGEIATLLSGRYIEIPIYPLSFSEFLMFKNIDKNSRLIDQAYEEYEKYGGFPSVVLADENIKDTILSGIFDTIVLNDVALRSGIKDPAVLKAIIHGYLFFFSR